MGYLPRRNVIWKSNEDIFRNWAKKEAGKYEPEVARCLYVLGYLNITKQEKEVALAHLIEGIETLKPHLKREHDLYEGHMNSLLMTKDHSENLGKIEIKKSNLTTSPANDTKF